MKKPTTQMPLLIALTLASVQAFALERPATKESDCSQAPLEQNFASVLKDAAEISQATEKLGAPAIALPGEKIAQSSVGQSKPTRAE